MATLTDSSSTPTLEKATTNNASFDPIQFENQLSRQLSEVQTSSRDNVRKITGFRWLLLCAAIYATAFLYGLDTTIAADVQSAVIETFDDITQLAWLGAGFTLGSVAVILPYGALYSKFSLKYLYIAGIVLFELGSVLCGAAPSMNALIVGRVIAGTGGTGMYLGVLNHISAFTTREERGTYITGIGFVWGLGACLGPVIGGAFSVSSATWRWGFYINLVVGAVTAPIYIFNLPNVHPAPGIPVWERVKNIDYVGSVLSAGMWVAFSIAFVFAGNIWEWQDGRTIATITVFSILTVAYMLQQYFLIFTTPETRSFPIHLLKFKIQTLTAICSATSYVALYIPVYFIPIYFQFVQNDSALEAAVRLLPFLLVAVAFNLASGFMLSKIKYYMPVYLVSGLLITLGGSLLYVYLQPGTPTAHIYGISVLLAVGTGMTIQIGYAVATLKVEPHDVASSISIQNVVQMGGTTIGLIIGVLVFESAAVRNISVALAGEGFSRAQIRAIVAGAQSVLFEQLSIDVKAKAILGITHAMQASFILVIVSGVMIVVSACLMKREKLFGEIIAVG
ncbi:major facilitator superfamily domain-containing protein [Xylariales sp. PMI_506]|nr:major facilitator superfamily domain-containing protein [Xylariales sp. PMI_506]